MYSEYEPNVKATIAYLKHLTVEINNTTVNETLQKHPDWPSLLCISDSLNKWNIPNVIGKIEVEKIGDLQTPFIAYTYDRLNPLAVITEVTTSTIRLYQKKYDKLAEIRKEDFLKTWNGVYIISQPNEQSGEKDFELIKRKAFLTSLIPVGLFTLLISLSFLFIYKAISSSINATAIYLQYTLMLAGVIVTILLLWYEIDNNNPVLQKACTGIVKGNCNAILTAKQAKIFNWLSWSEVGFFYFAGGLLLLLFTPIYTIPFLAWLNILALPYTVFSIYYQWRVAKQWCLLCLIVQSLLIVGGVNVFINHLHTPLTYASPVFFVYIVTIYLLPILLWYSLKPLALKLHERKNIERQYLRLKFNIGIFDFLLKKQKPIISEIDGLGIDLGNPLSTNILVKVSNPYCGSCEKAHVVLERLLDEIPNLKTKIIFATSPNPNDISYDPVSHLLAIAEEKDELKMKKALDDWYLPEKKVYINFAKKYPVKGELKNQFHKIGEMNNWCKNNEIESFPTIFFNGHRLPKEYTIENLSYLIPK